MVIICTHTLVLQNCHTVVTWRDKFVTLLHKYHTIDNATRSQSCVKTVSILCQDCIATENDSQIEYDPPTG